MNTYTSAATWFREIELYTTNAYIHGDAANSTLSTHYTSMYNLELKSKPYRIIAKKCVSNRWLEHMELLLPPSNDVT